MKFLVLSDLHGAIENLDKLDSQFSKADAVLFAGDFAKFGEEETGLPSLKALCKKHDVIYAVIGNCDNPDFLSALEEQDISVQNTLTNYEGLSFAGSGGGSKFTGTTPNERTDEELASDLKIISESDAQNWDNLVVIMHNPPLNTACDRVESGAHVGSAALRSFIEKYKPLAVICGHIHESAAIDTIENTTIINPGALLEGKYAWLTISKTAESYRVESATLEHI